MWIANVFFCLIGAMLMTGCAIPTPRVIVPQAELAQGREIAIFFDGTDNGPSDETNVFKLYNMIKKRPDILTFYIEGVGVGGKIIGAGTGWGISNRVKQAYSFLIENYRDGDKIYIFGFSRGAYTARILTAMLYYAGIPEVPNNLAFCRQSDPNVIGEITQLPRNECVFRVSEMIFWSYKGDKEPAERASNIKEEMKSMGLVSASLRPVPVTVLGLWDTVEALGFVDTWEAIKKKMGFTIIPDPGERNGKYGDQLCNVEYALQALSIDDDRADVFTPKLVTLPHLITNRLKDDHSCGAINDFSKVNEVWFSGAHSDVGGGYKDCEVKSDCISNVSLNWMIRELARKSKIITSQQTLPADTLSPSHDSENGSRLYAREQRDLRQLVQASVFYNHGKPKIHCSVVERLAQKTVKDHEFNWSIQPVGCFKADQIFLEYLGSSIPRNACTDDGLIEELPTCWFTVVK